jgi:hypothetical protein
MKSSKLPPQSWILHWRYHDSGQVLRRVWEPGWPADMFEILNKEDWENLEKMAKRFVIELVEQED